MAKVLPGIFVGLMLVAPGALLAQTCNACPGTILPVGQCPTSDIVHTGFGCSFNNCQTPQATGPILDVLPQGGGVFTVRMTMTVTAPWNESEAASRPNSTLDMIWFDVSPAPEPFTSGGNPSLCEYLASDRVHTHVEKTGLTCAGAPYDFGTYSLRSQVCGGPCPPPFPPQCGCGRWVDSNGLAFAVTKVDLGCPTPRKHDCRNCRDCVTTGGGCGVNAGGKGPACKLPAAGAHLYYAAGGAGSDASFPGTASWTPVLGRGWSHDFAQRIVLDPDDTHVWLVTNTAIFREWSGLSGGVYGTISPSDEKRTLRRTAGGWELAEQDGTVHVFNNAGLWNQTVDKNGNAKTATYNGSNQLTSVSFLDGRSETFTYHPAGKLASITEVGVGGSPARTWSYTWTGDDLTRADRPDGTAWELFYQGGLLARWDLIGTDLSRRVEGAWEYDAQGNVVKAWRGDPLSTGANAVELYTFAYDNAVLPAQTQVTDPFGKVTTYAIARDTVSDVPKITQINGDCPVCGTGPSSTFTYADPVNPLLPTQVIDSRGLTTQFSYDAKGQMTSKTEAAGTPLARTTAWQYANPSFPAFPTRQEMPSTSGGAAQRVTIFSYNASGDVTTRTIQGAEGGGSFSFDTVSTFNAAGQPLTVDPPGYDTADQTAFTYDPTRGNLLPLTRTDPLIGATTFSYDGFNRRTSVIDPNGVETVTTYDSLHRVASVTQKGATLADDLVSTYQYNAFGDLFRTILPRGDLIEYGYDVAGRLISIERKSDAATHGERTFYTLDSFGHRIKEELQSWNGSAWITESFTDFVYTSRCHLDKTVNADGSFTEFVYDCAGNLEKVWDANHPPQGSGGGGGGGDDCDVPPCEPPGEGGPNPPTQTFQYDALNRLISVTQPWTGAGGTTAVTTYSYDVQDHLAGVTDAEGNTTTYTYSDRDLMTQEVSPVSGATTSSYNEHGELIGRIDARGVVMTRTVDALDRVTLEDYPDNALDTAYTYDDPALAFSKGKLTEIARSGSEVAYSYDRFGRVLQDGELVYAWDKNGNRTEIGYPGSVTARFTHDFADREASLEMQVGSAAPQAIVSGATYKPFGPLTGFTFGNGLGESRSFTNRYFPQRIEVPGRLDVTYATDKVGNILSLDRMVGPDHFVSTFVYQDPQYFLTEGNGPWGRRAWSYNRIGNRLSETPPPDLDPPVESLTYSYLANPAGGHNPRLTRIEPAPGDEPGSRLEYGFDAAGNQTTVAHFGAESLRRTNFLDYSTESRLAQMHTSDGPTSTELLYDGREFLRRSRLTATTSSDFEQAEPVYSSEGLLLARRLHKQTTRGGRGDTGDPPTSRVVMETSYVFYFAGRPVAQLTRPQVGGGADTLLYLTTDHLGTPIQAMDTAEAIVWEGGLEPFGAPFVFPGSQPPEEGDPEPPEEGDGDTAAASGSLVTAATATMENAGIFLRFPGQWDDSSFRSLSLHGGLYYNVYRWYMSGTGRYTKPDPLSKIARSFGHGLLLTRPEPVYGYARANPLVFMDPYGLASLERSRCITQWVAGSAAAGAGIGAVIGGTVGGVAGGAAAGGACTPVAPGVGTVGCGAAGGAAGASGGASAGAAAGGALGGTVGGFLGMLFCPPDRCEPNTDERRRAHEHCLMLYVMCTETPGRHKFEQGKRCQDCFDICRREGEWPFHLCRLNYYPHGV